MDTTPRKLGDPIPVRLLLGPDGMLSMADGSDPRDYLKSVRKIWIKRGFATAGAAVPVCISTLPIMESIETQAVMHRHHSA